MLLELPPDPSLVVEIASTGTSKGLAQTDGPQLEVVAAVFLGDFFLETYGKNVQVSEDDGAETGAAVGWERSVVGFSLSAQVGLKRLLSTRSVDQTALELHGEIARGVGPVRAIAKVTYSPDDTGATTAALFIEGGLQWQVRNATRLSVEIGRRERGVSPDYTAFNAGVTQTIAGRFTVDLRYYDTAERDLGSVYRERLILSARAYF